MMKRSTLSIRQEDRHLIRQAAARRNTTIQNITHQIIRAGLKEVAPEVLEVGYNAHSDITPEQFQALYRSEKAALSKPVLRRAR